MIKQRMANVEKVARGRRHGRLKIVVYADPDPPPDPATLEGVYVLIHLQEVDNWRERSL